uniref:Uncharacterized protein n=1 Tax=Romanomermis culicivorax TaxID=13658 RepID=A0A915JZ66_ROMCU
METRRMDTLKDNFSNFYSDFEKNEQKFAKNLEKCAKNRRKIDQNVDQDHASSSIMHHQNWIFYPKRHQPVFALNPTSQ